MHEQTAVGELGRLPRPTREACGFFHRASSRTPVAACLDVGQVDVAGSLIEAMMRGLPDGARLTRARAMWIELGEAQQADAAYTAVVEKFPSRRGTLTAVRDTAPRYGGSCGLRGPRVFAGRAVVMCCIALHQ